MTVVESLILTFEAICMKGSSWVEQKRQDDPPVKTEPYVVTVLLVTTSFLLTEIGRGCFTPVALPLSTRALRYCLAAFSETRYSY